MNYSLLLQTIMLRLGRNKLKTCLMGLGIVVSVLATVLVQTAGSGFRGAFNSFIDKAYPADTVWLVSGTGLMAGGARNGLRIADIETIQGSIAEITTFDPIVQGGVRDLKHGSSNTRVPVTGVSEKAVEVRRRGVSQGEFLSEEDVRTRAHVALIGATTAHKLFGAESPLGAQLFIDNVAFTIKGVLDAVGVDPHGGDQDDMLQLPYTTVMEQMTRLEVVSGVTFTVKDRRRVEAVAAEVGKIMRARHHIGAGQEDDFSIITPVLMQGLVERSFSIFRIFLPLISGTAFLISGLVVLAIMLIAIKQRTPEIGLRKALGARQFDLQMEILMEVTIISLIAALVGLIIAQIAIIALAPVLAGKFGVTGLRTGVPTLFAGMLAAIATGVLGALLPARRAARLNPVIALK